MSEPKARALGFNHVALEVGDIDAALEFYGNFVEFELRGKSDTMAFIDLGDQFIALQKGRRQSADDGTRRVLRIHLLNAQHRLQILELLVKRSPPQAIPEIRPTL